MQKALTTQRMASDAKPLLNIEGKEGSMKT